MIVTCDSCNKEFNNNELNREEKIIGLGTDKIINITRVYLQCPHCGKQYDCFFETQQSVTLTNVLKKLKRKLKHNINNEKEYKKIYKKINRVECELKKEMKSAELIWRKN